jgi:ergothioneine biosynthesis protein EgtB
MATSPNQVGAGSPFAANRFATDPLCGGESIAARYDAVRALTEALAAPLTPEDQQVQTTADVSPTKWHLAHSAWFFETFLLLPQLAGYVPFHPRYGYLFNSYYEAVGPRHARARRGDLSRPSVAEILAYRAHVDAAMRRLMANASASRAAPLIELGLHHEQQHQELILMDIKHVFGSNPLAPAYGEIKPSAASSILPLAFHDFAGGLHEIGAPAAGEGAGFAFDNETPRHKTHLIDFRLATRLVTNGEYLEFIRDGGYRNVAHWLSDGWDWVRAEGITAPLYWRGDEAARPSDEAHALWREFTLTGDRPLDLAAPVCHVSYYEADAYARWSGHRLASEAEWEAAAVAQLAGEDAETNVEAGANLLGSGHFHPAPPPTAGGSRSGLRQMFGDVWEWTSSAYSAYPGYRPSPGAVGEYNGKFMINQMVLRGGCALTPPGHIRATYRNFFHPHQRWQMAGIRLAGDL